MSADTMEELKAVVQALSDRAAQTEQLLADTVAKLQTFESQVVGPATTRVVSIETSLTDLKDRLHRYENQVHSRLLAVETKPPESGSRFKEILESKAISNLKTITDGKGFGEWAEKFRNSMEQARPGSRGTLHFLENQVNEEQVQERLVTEAGQVEPGEIIRELYIESLIPGMEEGEEKEKAREALEQKHEEKLLTLDRGLWIVLVDKSEGEAYSRISGATQGEGLWAYVRLYKWFSRTSSLGLIQRRRALLQPTQCKHDWEVSTEVEKWETRLRRLETEEGNTEKMGDKSRIATAREILTPKLREYVDLRESELNTYSRFREAVMRYATTKRVEHNTQQRKPDDMDTSHVWTGPESGSEEYAGWKNSTEDWTSWDHTIAALQESIGALAKAKGKAGKDGIMAKQQVKEPQVSQVILIQAIASPQVTGMEAVKEKEARARATGKEETQVQQVTRAHKILSTAIATTVIA